MMKKYFFIILFYSFLSASEYCPFCDPEIISAQSFYEDDSVIGLYTHKPCVEGHCLIIPKRHVERYEELSDTEMASISNLIKKTQRAVENAYDKHDYLILEKNGKSAGQDVMHVHFHLIPTKPGSSRFVFLSKLLLRLLFPPISQSSLDENRAKIQKELSY